MNLYTRALRSVLFVSCCLAPLAWMQIASGGEPAENETTELGSHMDEMGHAWKQVRKQVADPASNAATAELVAGMIKQAKAAVDLKPELLEDIPDDQKADFIASYKEGIEKLVTLLGKLETALRADRNEEAQELVIEIGKHQRHSHKEFKKPEEH